MADTIETARKALQDRVREIDAEKKQLEAALKALTGSDGRASRRRATGTRRPQRAPRGQRRAQVLRSLKSSSGLRPRDLAKKHRISNSQVSSVLKQLTEAGEVEKKDGRYYPKKKRAARKS